MSDELEIPDGEGLDDATEGLEVELGEELPDPEPVETPAVEADPLDAKLEAARAAGEDVLEAYLASLEKEVEEPEEEEDGDDDDLTPEQIDASEFVRFRTYHSENEMKEEEEIDRLAANYRMQYDKTARIAEEVGVNSEAHQAAKENALAIYQQIKKAESDLKLHKSANRILDYAERVAAAIPQLANVKAQYAHALFKGVLDINQPVTEHIKIMRQAGVIKPTKALAPKVDKARWDKIKAKLGSKKNSPSTSPASRSKPSRHPLDNCSPDERAMLAERGLTRSNQQKAR